MFVTQAYEVLKEAMLVNYRSILIMVAYVLALITFWVWSMMRSCYSPLESGSISFVMFNILFVLSGMLTFIIIDTVEPQVDSPSLITFILDSC